MSNERVPGVLSVPGAISAWSFPWRLHNRCPGCVFEGRSVPKSAPCMLCAPQRLSLAELGACVCTLAACASCVQVGLPLRQRRGSSGLDSVQMLMQPQGGEKHTKAGFKCIDGPLLALTHRFWSRAHAT